MDTTTQPSALDSFFGALSNSASTLLGAYTAAELNRISAPAADVSSTTTGGGNSKKPADNTMIYMGLGLAFVVVLALQMRARG